MIIDVMSKKQVLELLEEEFFDEPTIIISICDDNTRIFFKPIYNLEATYTLTFSDIEKETPGCTLFNKDMAYGIRRFVDKHKHEVDNIIVHCLAGISRSSSVAAVLKRYLGQDDEEIFTSGRYLPRKHIYKLMCEACDLEFNESDFDKKLKMIDNYIGKDLDPRYVEKLDRILDISLKDNM